MVAIHPIAAWGKVPGPPLSDTNKAQVSRALTSTRTRGWQKLLPQPNIPRCIPLYKLRCIITLVSLVLVVTDIPRTGLGVRNLQEFYPIPLMPSTAVRFGPFNYPVLHIWRPNDSETSSTTEFAGTKGDQPISGARVWPYQYDTTSIGLRGAVELLNVTDFPSFLLYKPQPNQTGINADSLIHLSTAFNMLDAFITAALDQLTQTDGTRTTLRYATKHNWVDRIHHYVVRFASKNPAWRLHSLHAPRITRDTRSLAICSSSNAAGTKHRSSLRPRFCNHPGVWKCENPIDKSLPAVKLWEHMDLRLQTLQQRHPDLELDVVMLSSQRLSSALGAVGTTYYNYEALEIVVLTRGRRCHRLDNSSTGLSCRTIFVDDYRYERDIVQTNLVAWYGVISFLRGGAQIYLWARVLLLISIAYVATRSSAAGKLARNSRVITTAWIILAIPSEVIVYSSLLPVSCYAIALLLDGSFMDIYLDSYWASVGGSVNFELVSFFESTAVQMRNIWLLALLGVLVVYAVRKTRAYWSDGIPGIRGLLIGFTSTLTALGPYKKTTFRNTDIINVFQVAGAGQMMDTVHCSPVGHFNMSTYFSGDNTKMLLFCISAVVGLTAGIKTLGFLAPTSSWIRRETQDAVLSSTQVVPCGARRLWPTSVLSVQFHVAPLPLDSSSIPLASTVKGQLSSTPEEPQDTKVWPFHFHMFSSNSSVATPSRRTLLGNVHGSSTEIRSILQLMNIAMMTDPWNFFWLRVRGVQLHLYRIQTAPFTNSSNTVSKTTRQTSVVVLPYAEDEMEEQTGLATGDFELIDSASSRDVSMSVLLLSG